MSDAPSNATVSEIDDVNELKDDILVDSPARYLGLMGRVGRAIAPLAKSVRYVGYTSDVGEAFRPMISPKLVSGAYYVSYAYVLADTSFAAYRTRQAGGTNTDIARVASHTLVFQGLASLALPAVIIHTQVNMATKAFASVKSLQPFQRFGPTAAGLALIPFLPMICDEPVEKIVDTAFDTLWPTKKHARQDLVESAPETKKEL